MGTCLNHIPEKEYTMVHGVCTDVGVGGFLLGGGGVNYLGASQRYLSGSSNVLHYTMVDASGDIYKAGLILYQILGSYTLHIFSRNEGIFFLTC